MTLAGRAIEESDTYLAILEEGQIKQIRKDIPRVARWLFGAPAELMLTRLQSITNFARLERIYDRLLDATGWDDLLATP